MDPRVRPPLFFIARGRVSSRDRAHASLTISQAASAAFHEGFIGPPFYGGFHSAKQNC
jgi:hypothetical protein